MMLGFLLGIAALFLAMNFDAVVHAEVNVAIPLGDEGCAVTSAAMVAGFYGIKTDPQQLNTFLTRTGGFTNDGLIHWRRVPSIAPAHLRALTDRIAGLCFFPTI